MTVAPYDDPGVLLQTDGNFWPHTLRWLPIPVSALTVGVEFHIEGMMINGTAAGSKRDTACVEVLREAIAVVRHPHDRWMPHGKGARISVKRRGFGLRGDCSPM